MRISKLYRTTALHNVEVSYFTVDLFTYSIVMQIIQEMLIF